MTISKPQSPVALALREITENVAARISVAAVQQSNFIPINMIG